MRFETDDVKTTIWKMNQIRKYLLVSKLDLRNKKSIILFRNAIEISRPRLILKYVS